MKVLVTGSTGFVGGAFVSRAVMDDRFTLRAAVRSQTPAHNQAVETVRVEGLTPSTDWSEALEGCEVVVHTAARVHVMQETAADSLAAFRQVNVEGTLNLARQAIRAGVRRFVFISSIKVNGEKTSTDHPYTATDKAAPLDAYGVSKYEAEVVLRDLSTQTGMELVILRPPLIYGPGVKANFLNLLKIIDRGIPLPLAKVANCRSLVFLGNLVDAIETVVCHPGAAGNIYLVSDGEDISTPDLVRQLSAALNKSPRLIPVSPRLLRLAGKCTGKTATVERLLGSLIVDGGEIRRDLDWRPPFTMHEGIAATVNWYKSGCRYI